MTIRTRLTGFDLLNEPLLNKGTAFTERERDVFALHGLLPPHIGTLEDQVVRRARAFNEIPTAFGKYRFMRDLQDANETLFYALIQRDIEAALPIVYTPTVGEGCQRFSEIWHKARGLFLSYPNRGRIADILAHQRYDAVRCVVVSDGERILGLGDQGAGGMGIPIGKLSLYTALGGIPPQVCLPVFLDAGTDNEDRLRDPLYVGWSHERVRGADYDELVQVFVDAVKRRWPHVLLQWEDFAGHNAMRLLDRYRDDLCTFNDDIQGTAAVTTGALLSAITATGASLAEQRVVFFGFGAAGRGIAALLHSRLRASGLSAEEARSRLWPVDREGPTLIEVVRNVKPTVLIGVSGQPGAFTEDVVRTMAATAERPIIFPLSNPTSRAEARPDQLLAWSHGRAIVGTGSPFEPVHLHGRTIPIDQINNSYIFPGLALAAIATRARRVSDGMIEASAAALASLAPRPLDGGRAPLLPGIASMRSVSRVVALAVGRQAIAEGLSDVRETDLPAAIDANRWEARYEDYELDDR